MCIYKHFRTLTTGEFFYCSSRCKRKGAKKIIQVDYNKYNKRDYIDFSVEWLQIEDYELKILILASVLEDVDLAFNGTLKTMCEWLGIKATTSNNNHIKQAIETLSDNGYIEYSRKGQKYIITITDKGKEENKIVAIRKCWVETFKNYKEQVEDENLSISWIKLLKIFVYLCSNRKSLYTQQEIADDLNISKGIVATALKVLEQCSLQGLRVIKHIEKAEFIDNSGQKQTYNRGTEIVIGIEFEEN